MVPTRIKRTKEWRPVAVSLLTIFLMMSSTAVDAMLNFTDITLFGVVRNGTKTGEQDNLPQMVESVAPTPGNPWTWTASGMSGFSPTASITFTYENDGVGQPNELHTEASLNWSGFQDSAWASGATGSFTLTLSNGVDSDRNYAVNLALRSIDSIDFTVIAGQSQAEADPICAAPASGGTYTWMTSGVSGIVPTPVISFTFDGGDTGQTDGRVSVSFSGDWSNANGTFTLTLQDGTRPESVFDGSRPSAGASRPNLNLRQLMGDGYTVIDGQSSSGDSVSMAGVAGFTFSASGFAGFAPAPTTLTFDAMGAVAACTCANWNQDGTLTLTVKDGYRPGSIFDGRGLTLRGLEGDGYTVIRNQSSGGQGINAAGANGFTFSASGFAGLVPVPTTLAFDSMGAVTACTCTNWNQDGTFTLTIQDGARPDSAITGRGLSLRQLVGDGYTVIRNQSSGGQGINAAGANGFTFSASGFAGLVPVPTPLAFDSMGAVTACTCTNWNQDGTFTLTIQDGARPDSAITGRSLSLKCTVPDPLVIPDDGGAGSVNAEVEGDAGPWDWTEYEDGLANSVLTAPDTFGSPTLTISWAAGALEPDETGVGMVTVQHSDGSSPASTVALETVVTEAPQVPVTCWPILAAILAVVAVVLIMGQKYRTVR